MDLRIHENPNYQSVCTSAKTQMETFNRGEGRVPGKEYLEKHGKLMWQRFSFIWVTFLSPCLEKDGF